MKFRKFNIKHIFSLLKQTYQEWNEDEPFRESAILAYYAIFSLPALMIIVTNVAGLFFDSKEAVQGEISSQISNMIGQEAAESVVAMIGNASENNNTIIAIVIGVGTLLFGATGVFYQLQMTLNKIWGVEIKPKKAGIKKLAIDRATSLGIILAIGFLLLISLSISALLSGLSGWISRQLPEVFVYGMYVVDFLFSLSVITLLFALIYKILPDVEISWKAVWLGSIVTAILFVIGKFALGIYFGKSDPASVYGAAGSVILILLWVSYSGLIFFFGAEFTQVFAKAYGFKIEPSSFAQRTAKFRLRDMEAHEKKENA